MNDLKKIYERMDIRQICEFLLHGVEDSETDMRSHEKLLEEECKPLYDRLESLYPDEKERDDFLSDITQALIAYEQVYIEIGVKAGARLIFQLLSK